MTKAKIKEQRMRWGRYMAIATLLIVSSVEVLDRKVIGDLVGIHKSQEYFWDSEIEVKARKKICQGESASGYASRSGVDYGRYQHRYSYTFFIVNDLVEVHVMGTSPERQWPLWIFSIGIDEFKAIADSSDTYEVYKVGVSDFCQKKQGQ